MAPFLAYADRTDLTGSQWSMILIGLFAIGAVAVLTLVPIALARRRHRRAEGIAVAALFWGLLTGGSIVQFVMAKVEWSKEYVLLIKTGYYDPANTSGTPPWPWRLWAALAVAFVVLVACSLSGKRLPPPPPPQPPSQ